MKPLLVLFLCFFFSASTKNLIRLPRVERGTNRIIGGESARAGQFPWQVAIYKDTADGRYFCAGVLISDEFVLTAAQCVYDAVELTVSMGSTLLQGEDPNRVTVVTSSYMMESRFDPTVSLAHDIAVIKFRMPVELNDYIQPIVFANMGYLYPGRVVEAVGWGQTSDADSTLVEDLQFVEVAIVDQHYCQTYYGSQLFTAMICAEGPYNEGICYGDIGGPLITPALVGNHSVTVAISSWVSQNGCESLDPTGYTRVDAYNNWIVNATRDCC